MMKNNLFFPLFVVLGYFSLSSCLVLAEETRSPIRFNKNFPGGAIGTIEMVGDDDFRCRVEGQYNQFGRNRQPTWFYFRLDDVRDRTVTIRLTGLNGEYNNRPTRSNWSRDCPVVSADNSHWEHVTDFHWDAEASEYVFTLQPKTNSLWIAYIPPYVASHLERLLRETESSPYTLTEVIGKTLQQRDILLMTVTDFNVPDDTKKHYWVVARLHAWEAFTSYVAEGLVRFLIDEKNPQAARIRQEAIVRVVIMADPDGCEAGMVRFNLNGFDLNRSWAAIDLRSKQSLRDRSEVWYLKKAIVAAHREKPIDVLFNLHDHQTGYDLLETSGDGENYLAWYQSFEEKMEDAPRFLTNPKTRNKIRTARESASPIAGSAGELWNEYGIPHVLVEYNINRKSDTDYFLSIEDSLINGQRLILSTHFALP